MAEIVNHLGINPVNGGIPLSDSNITGIRNCIIGERKLSLLNCLLFDWELSLSMINNGIITEQYKP